MDPPAPMQEPPVPQESSLPSPRNADVDPSSPIPEVTSPGMDPDPDASLVPDDLPVPGTPAPDPDGSQAGLPAGAPPPSPPPAEAPPTPAPAPAPPVLAPAELADVPAVVVLPADDPEDAPPAPPLRAPPPPPPGALPAEAGAEAGKDAAPQASSIEMPPLPGEVPDAEAMDAGEKCPSPLAHLDVVPARVWGLEPEPVATVWKNRLVWTVLVACLFTNLFVLGLVGERSYQASINMQAAQLSRAASIVATFLSDIQAAVPNATSAAALRTCVQAINSLNEQQLAYGHELMLAQQTSKQNSGDLTYDYLTELKYAPDCGTSCVLQPSAPVLRSLTGRSDTMVGTDYNGEPVIAAYTYVEGFNVGLVWKVNEPPVRGLLTNELINAVAVCLSFIVVSLVALAALLHHLLLRVAKHSYRPPSEAVIGRSRCVTPWMRDSWPLGAVFLAITTQMVVVSVMTGVTVLGFVTPVYQMTAKQEMQLTAELLGGLLTMQATQFSGITSAATLVNHLNRMAIPDDGEAVLGLNTSSGIQYVTTLKLQDECAASGCSGSQDLAMQAALNRQQGAMYTQDYRPQPVLAGYLYVPAIAMGLVVKDDAPAIDQPLRSLTGVAAGICTAVDVVVLVLVSLFVLYLSSLLRQWWAQEPVPPANPIRRIRWVMQVTLFLLYTAMAVSCTALLLGLHSQNFRQETLLQLQVGAGLAEAALNSTSNKTAVLAFLQQFNARYLDDQMEIQAVTPDNTSAVGYLLPLKFNLQCPQADCYPAADTVAQTALAGGTGRLIGTDYRRVWVAAGYADGDDGGGVAVVVKEDLAASQWRFDRVIREVAVGLIAWVVVGGALGTLLLWWAVEQVVKARACGGCGLPQGRPGLFAGLCVLAVLLLDTGLLLFGYFQPHAQSLQIQGPMVLTNARLARGLLNTLAAQPPADLTRNVTQFLNYVNYQVLPRYMELQVVSSDVNGTVAPLAAPKYRSICPELVCPSGAAAYLAATRGLSGDTGTAEGPDYVQRRVLEAFTPVTALNAGLALTVEWASLYAMSDAHIIPQVVGCVFMFLVSVVGAFLIPLFGLLRIQRHMGYTPPPEEEGGDPVMLTVVLGAVFCLVLLVFVIVFTLWAALGEGFDFALAQTGTTLEAALRLTVGLLELRNGSAAGAVGFLNDYNYQILPGSMELLAAAAGAGPYLTQLKMRSLCTDPVCLAQPRCLEPARSGLYEAPQKNGADYRPDEVVAVAAPVPAGLLGPTAGVLGLKVDHMDLRNAWNNKTLWVVALLALAVWIVSAFLVLLFFGLLIRVLRRDAQVAEEVAQRVSDRQWDRLDEPFTKLGNSQSATLKPLRLIARRLKLFSAYTPAEFFVQEEKELLNASPAPAEPPAPAAAPEPPPEPSSHTAHQSSAGELKLTRITPVAEDEAPSGAVSSMAAPAEGAAPAAPPAPTEALRPVTALCFAIFNLDQLRHQLGMDAVTKIHSEVTDRLLQCMKQHQGLVHPWLWPLPKCFVTWNAVRTVVPNPAPAALLAALDLYHALQSLNLGLSMDYALTLQFGLAVVTGPAATGNWGSTAARQFGFMGDSITLLSPLAELNRALQSSILLDEATQRATEGAFVTRLVEAVDFGHSALAACAAGGLVHVYELLAESTPGAARPHWLQLGTDGTLEHFTAAMRHALGGEVAGAIQCLQAHLLAFPGDLVGHTKLETWRLQLRDLSKRPCAPRLHRDGWEARPVTPDAAGGATPPAP